MDMFGKASGTSLYITEFPKYDYYPQHFEVCLRSLQGVGIIEERCVTITLIDCDGDDPTCFEFHNFYSPEGESSSLRLSTNNIDSADYENVHTVKFYDLRGIFLGQSLIEDVNKLILDNRINQIIVASYYDKSGNWIKTNKIFLNR